MILKKIDFDINIASAATVELLELYEISVHNATDSAKESSNSYGAGYDSGYAAGMRHAYQLLTGQELN